MLPQVQRSGGGAGQQLGQAVGPAQQGHIFQAIDDQHANDRIGQNLAEVIDEGGHRLIGREDDKGNAAGQQRYHGNHRNGDDDL